jgi:membrane protein DedA with SNARE-associated domain
LIGITGAVAGDYASFLLGRRYGWPLIDRLRKYFFIKDAHLEKAKRLLDAHTGKALVIGRFNPVTRGIMPFLVGANRAPYKSFWFYNGLGAVLWVVLSVALGYCLGLGYSAVAATVAWGRFLVMAAIASVLIVWSYRFVNIRFHIFRRYELFALGLNLLSLCFLAWTIGDVFTSPPYLAGFDLWASALSVSMAGSAAGPRIAETAAWVSAVGGVTTVGILTVIGGMIMAYRKRWRSAAIMLLSVGSTALSVGWLKDLVLRVRPDGLVGLIPAPPAGLGIFFDHASLISDPSFPSGHAAFAAAFFVVVAYLLSFRVRSWIKRELLMTGCVLLTIAIGLSRLVLNVHWASDVIAGWSLGIFCATASILLVRYAGTLLAGKIREAPLSHS